MQTSSIVNILNLSLESCGTGFFVSPNGYILTCKHVLNKARYRRIGQIVTLKYADNPSEFKAKWIYSTSEEDLAILHTTEKAENYISFCDRDVINLEADCYGFPNGSKMEIKASVHVDQVLDNEKYIQLGKANSVTLGFSGGPVIYDGTAIGILHSITKTDQHGRLSEIAFAISAKHVLKLLSKYVSKKDICLGYGSKFAKCLNYVSFTHTGLCEECFTAQFSDDVKSLYKAQKYRIHESNGFFIAELNYGIATYYDAVFIQVKINELLLPNDLYCIPGLVNSSQFRDRISQIVVVTNAKIGDSCSDYIEKNNIVIRTKEELLRRLFDYEPYRADLVRYAKSEQLSKHYIEVYGTDFLPKGAVTHRTNELDQNENRSEYEYVNVDEDFNVYPEYFEYDENKYNEECDSVDTPKLLLKEYVNRFMVSKYKALLILGDYGSGKTSFCYTYALELLDNFIQNKANYLPLLIKLRGYNKAVGLCQLLTDYFVNDLGINNFNVASLKLLLKNLNIVLIFDGYDEVAKKVDFDIKYDVLKEICSLVESGTKIIVTCRPNYFQNESEFKQIFQNSHFPYEPGEKPLLNFLENSIEDLSPDQINYYIDSYDEELCESNISKAEFLRTIANTHDLTDLAKRPFLLYMIVCTLPKILQGEKGKTNTKINASKLYSVYTNSWIQREDRKNKTLIKQSDKELFCKELAFELYVSNSVSLSYRDFPKTIKRHFKDVNRIEDIDYFSHDIQSCSFLTSDRSGDFKFIHKSFMEYFVADRIVEKIIRFLDESKKGKNKVNEINSILGSTFLSMEICLFVQDILDIQKTTIQNISDYFADANSIAKSNILSLLSKTDINMASFFLHHDISDVELSRVDFSNTVFHGEIIQKLSFENAQFYNVTFNRVTFIDCDFSGTIFEKCKMEDLKFLDCDFVASSWKKTSVFRCSFSSESDYIDDTYSFMDDYGCCNLENSSWQESIINKCIFNNCSLVDATMHSMIIKGTLFSYVDFSGTEILGSISFEGNTLSDVTGEPYEF